MHKKLIIHTLKTTSSFFLNLEKKRRSQLVFLKSSKILQKKIIKDHRFLIKAGIACSAPILKLSLIKGFFRKKFYRVSFVRINKKVLNVARILKRLFATNSYKTHIILLVDFYLLLIKGIQTPILKTAASSQMEALVLKKFFRFKWF